MKTFHLEIVIRLLIVSQSIVIDIFLSFAFLVSFTCFLFLENFSLSFIFLFFTFSAIVLLLLLLVLLYIFLVFAALLRCSFDAFFLIVFFDFSLTFLVHVFSPFHASFPSFSISISIASTWSGIHSLSNACCCRFSASYMHACVSLVPYAIIVHACNTPATVALIDCIAFENSADLIAPRIFTHTYVPSNLKLIPFRMCTRVLQFHNELYKCMLANWLIVNSIYSSSPWKIYFRINELYISLYFHGTVHTIDNLSYTLQLKRDNS